MGKCSHKRRMLTFTTKQLNKYLETVLSKNDLGKDVHNNINGMFGKQFYKIHKKKVTGKKLDDELESDLEAAKEAWPNFKTLIFTPVSKTIYPAVQIQWKILLCTPLK